MSKISIDIDLWRKRVQGLPPDIVKDFIQLIFMMRDGARVSTVYVSSAYGNNKQVLLQRCFEVDNEGFWHYPDVTKALKGDEQRKNAGFKLNNTIRDTSRDTGRDTSRVKKPKTNSKKPVTKDSSLFTRMNEMYFTWFELLYEVKPHFDSSDGAALKTLITFLKSQKGEPEESFRYILNHWHKLDDFTQKKTKLRDIKNNINSIITQLKNGTKKGKRNYDSAIEDFIADPRNGLTPGN